MLITDDRKITIKGGKLDKDYRSNTFVLKIDLANVTEDQKNKWIYAERKIAFQRIREVMSEKEIDDMIKSAPIVDEIPVITISALNCGKRIRTKAQMIADAIQVINSLSDEARKDTLSKLNLASDTSKNEVLS